MLSLAELERLVAAGEVDTVIVAFTDMQGRLVGKRVSARLFVDEVAAHGAECCNYLLAVDVDMNTVRRLCDVELGHRLRRHGDDAGPRHPAAHSLAARHGAGDGRPGLAPTAARSPPRRAASCAASSTGCAERGLVADVATELEFIVFDEPIARRGPSGYRGLTPASDYNIDYAILASSRMEPLLRDIRLRHGGRGPATARPSRASATAASRRSGSVTTTRWSPATTTPSTRTAPRRSPTSTARA